MAPYLYLRGPARVGLSASTHSSSFIVSKMEMLEYFTLGNILIAVIFTLIFNLLIELYQFRNMPPGPRLTTLPFIGNFLSFDSGESLREATARFVYKSSSLYSVVFYVISLFGCHEDHDAGELKKIRGPWFSGLSSRVFA